MAREKVKPRRARTRTALRAVLALGLGVSLLVWYESTVRNIELLHKNDRVLYMTGGRLQVEGPFLRHVGVSGWSLRAPLGVTPVDRRCEWGRDSWWGGRTWYLYLPLWIPAAVMGLVAAVPWLPRRRRTANSCRACGYDCSGLGESSRCPECGEATP